MTSTYLMRQPEPKITEIILFDHSSEAKIHAPNVTKEKSCQIIIFTLVTPPYAMALPFLPGQSFEIMISLNNCSSFCALISYVGSIAATQWGDVARHAHDISLFASATVSCIKSERIVRLFAWMKRKISSSLVRIDKKKRKWRETQTCTPLIHRTISAVVHAHAPIDRNRTNKCKCTVSPLNSIHWKKCTKLKCWTEASVEC